MEQERDDREKQLASERRTKMWQEQLAYLDGLRSSIFLEENWLQCVPVSESSVSAHNILERCLQLKTHGLASNFEDWKWACLTQIIVSSLLYVGMQKTTFTDKEYPPVVNI